MNMEANPYNNPIDEIKNTGFVFFDCSLRC